LREFRVFARRGRRAEREDEAISEIILEAQYILGKIRYPSFLSLLFLACVVFASRGLFGTSPGVEKRIYARRGRLAKQAWANLPFKTVGLTSL
jgi:hypothetical protein